MPWKLQCKEHGKRFRSLDAYKEHMTRHHGGYTESEIVNAVNDPENPDAPASEPAIAKDAPFEVSADSPAARTSEPRRSTRRNRELNDKLNSALDTIIEKALGMPVSEARMEELKVIRGDVRNACFGVEFDFDEKVVKVGRRWMLIALLVALYVFPYVPPIPFQKLVEDFKKQGKGGKKIESDKNNRNSGTEGQRKDVPIVADVRARE